MSGKPELRTLITGAAGGIGRAVANELIRRGHQVVLLDLPSTLPLDPGAPGGPRVEYGVDVTDALSVNSVVDRVERTIGPLTGLVNAAGILRPGGLEDVTVEQWQTTLDVNTTGVFNVLKAVVPRMAQRGRGSVVTVASNAAATPRSGMVAYAASKAAAQMLTRSVGLEYAGKGVRCNVVAPGSTNTTMLSDLTGVAGMEATSVRGTPELFKLGIPLGRIAQPQQIARSVAFLLSDDADHITLETLTVDGGATLGQ